MILIKLALQEIMRAVDEGEAKFHAIIATGLARGMDYKRAFDHFIPPSSAKKRMEYVTPETFAEGLKVCSLHSPCLAICLLWLVA